MSNEHHTDGDSIEPEPTAYTVHHVPEPAAERAVDRFRRKVERLERGDTNDVATSGVVYLEDSLHEVTDGPGMFLVDGEPLDEWLDGRLDETTVRTDE